MEEVERVWTHAQWAAICPDCNERRFLWPNNQEINSLDDPRAKFIHRNGLEGCS